MDFFVGDRPKRSTKEVQRFEAIPSTQDSRLIKAGLIASKSDNRKKRKASLAGGRGKKQKVTEPARVAASPKRKPAKQTTLTPVVSVHKARASVERKQAASGRKKTAGTKTAEKVHRDPCLADGEAFGVSSFSKRTPKPPVLFEAIPSTEDSKNIRVHLGIFPAAPRSASGRPESVPRMKIVSEPPLQHVPFVFDSEGGKGSLLLRVRSRSRWVAAAPDLVALCDESARRRSLNACPKAAFYDSPLALDFVEDRLQLDEPLEGW
jgi:hypothetical protein